MRNKAIFSVFGRKLPSGKRVYYYQCYDARGTRQFAKSTGLTRKTEAVAYCMKLFKDGLLIPEQKAPTFAEFSSGWWDVDTCRYLKWRQLHNPLTDSTIRLHKLRFHTHIRDYFAKFRIDEITPDVVESWLLGMCDKTVVYGNKNSGTKLKPQTINQVYSTFKLMINEAVRRQLIKENPCRDVKELKEEEMKHEILTAEEVRKLFPYNWAVVWESDLMFKINRLAASTGLRIAEILGLKTEYVFDDYIYITGQYTRFGYVPHTKTKLNRNIPISGVMRQELDELLTMNRDGYVFSEDGGKTPVTEDRVRRQFDRALENIGISRTDKSKRNLSFHSWRHFLNTLLRMKDIADSKVQAVTGHITMGQTERYTHFDTRKFTEVRNVQTELLTFKEPETSVKTKSGKKVIA